jgi:hypothetical protein
VLLFISMAYNSLDHFITRLHTFIHAHFYRDTPWLHHLVADANVRSNTSVCLTVDAKPEQVKAMVALLDNEGVAFDIGAYRDGKHCELLMHVVSPLRVARLRARITLYLQPALFPVAPLAGAAATEIVPLPHYAPIPCLYEFQTTAILPLFCIVGRRRVVTRDAAKRPSGPLRVCADTTHLLTSAVQSL